MVNSDQLKRLGIDVNLVDAFNETFDRFGLTTIVQQACWIGQCGHECGNFRIMEENLNYRAATLLKLFPLNPKRPWGFTPESAAEYERKPQKIANRIYSNRMGNRDEASGDGWRFRGSGFLQLTGHSNFYHAGYAGAYGLRSLPWAHVAACPLLVQNPYVRLSFVQNRLNGLQALEALSGYPCLGWPAIVAYGSI